MLKQCVYCRERKTEFDFSKNKFAHDRLQVGCKTCTKKYMRSRQLQTKYGMTDLDFDFMFLDQKGKCKICETSLEYSGRSTHIDHCHSSNKVRGLLCHHCNVMLGMAKDNQIILAKAIEYLKESQDDRNL